jgi:hypothetical protein
VSAVILAVAALLGSPLAVRAQPPAPVGEDPYTTPYAGQEATWSGEHAPSPDESVRAGRVFLELAVGAAGLMGGGLLGIYLACPGGSLDCLDDMLAGAAIGAGLATPLTICGIGRGLDGNGSCTWTLVGTTTGFLAWGAVGHATDWVPESWAAIFLPIIGGVLGFELSSDASAREAERISASIVPARGGAVVAVAAIL